ncbi:MAG: fatty acid desaturase family protein [Hydrogenophaga sp.]|nr:fatty acid desaturase family protein [Hydrogenophaga sp.]
MAPTSEVLADMANLRQQLRQQGSPYSELFKLHPARVLIDIAFDWVLIVGAVAAVVWLDVMFVPLAVLVLANRQRALGNILHDAGHRNIWREKAKNDLIARVLVAPLLFASLSRYREAHFQHHLELGRVQGDPDLIPGQDHLPSSWIVSYARCLFSKTTWRGSLGGHLLDHEVGWRSKAFILGWWAYFCGLLIWLIGGDFALVFMSLWLIARATLFHCITTFREMCDHFGLLPGGVFGFTRDMVCHGPWRWIIHPRNNGYHLTHHLLPAVPYYRLPEAHALLRQVPMFEDRSHICSAYFRRGNAVTTEWQSRAVA